jgi:hypothetical protein
VKTWTGSGQELRTKLQAVENVAVNDEQIEELRRWASFLSADERREVRAAAKAILLLVDDLAAAKSQLAEERLMLVAEKIALSRRGAQHPFSGRAS